MGVWALGQDATNFSNVSKDVQENPTSFDTNVVLVGGGANMVLNEKPAKKRKLRGLKLRGFRQNQISTPYLTYENDRRDQINTLGDF